MKHLKYILIVLLLVACSPQTKSWFDSSYTHQVGTVPSDVCIENGVPVIFNITSESDGDVSLVYLRNNGDVVMKHHPLNLIGTDWKEGGEFYFSGGICKK
jgi:hypothetical protein